VLRTLGFTRRQVVGAASAQASLVGVVAVVVVGVPLALLGANWGWRQIARDIGFVTELTTPWWIVVVASLGAVVVANLVAILPGLRAARTDLGLALRTE
jgi:ABC-type lipoprotein release transport system permease subunit